MSDFKFDIHEAKKLVTEFILHAGQEALTNWKNIDVEYHVDNVDVTTETDKRIENEFSNFVEKNFPGHGFSGEEFNDLKRSAEYMWYIDPIDGTKFYAKQVPLWSISISLVRKGVPVLGVIYFPTSGQIYSAIDGEGAYLNDDLISITQEADLGKLQLALDMALSSEEYNARKETITPVLERLYTSFYRVRSLGSGTASITWLAQGFFGCYFNPFRTEMSMYDIYTGMLIAKEAGAYIHKITISPGLYHFIFGNKEVVEKVVGIVADLK